MPSVAGLKPMPKNQDELIAMLGREDQGYNATPPLGDCGVLAVIQAILAELLPFEAVLPAALAIEREMRSQIAIKLEEHPVLSAAWSRSNAAGRSDFIETLNKHCSPKLKDDADNEDILGAVKSPADEGGAWTSPLMLSALAVALRRDIAVVDGLSVTMYTKEQGWYSWLEGANAASSWVATSSGVYSGPIADRDAGTVPVVAFRPDTLVIVFKTNHFWYTRKQELHNFERLVAEFGDEFVSDFVVQDCEPTGIA